MRKWLIFSMFVVLLADTMLGIGLGFGLGLSVKNLYLYALCGVVAVDAALRPGGIRVTDFNVHGPFVALIVYATASWVVKSLFAPEYRTVQGAVTLKSQLVDLYLFYLVFRYGVGTRQEFRWLLRAVLGVLLATSLLTLLDYLNLPDLGLVGSFKGRVEGPVGAANQYGALLAFLLPIAVAGVPDKHSAYRRLWWLGLLASLYLFVATGSRGAYVALVLSGIITAIWVRHDVHSGALVRYGLLASILLGAAILAAALLSQEVLDQVTTKTTGEDISSGRSLIWRAALLIMSERPLSFIVGNGWNAFASSGIWKSAHSVYIDAFYELGGIGLLLLLWLLAAVVLHSRRTIRSSGTDDSRIFVGHLCGMLAFCAAMAFVEVPVPANLVWMINGLVGGLAATARAEKSANGGRSAIPGSGEVDSASARQQ